VGNALKFTEQGEVCVFIQTAAGPDDKVNVTIEVRDTGIGLALEQKDSLFRSFSQIHEQRTPGKFGGAGLGLSICRQLTELMKGKVWLKNSSKQGSTFAFTIPCPLADSQVVQSKVC
jgi:signal transduction histidine kinase